MPVLRVASLNCEWRWMWRLKTCGKEPAFPCRRGKFCVLKSRRIYSGRHLSCQRKYLLLFLNIIKQEMIAYAGKYHKVRLDGRR